MNTVLLTGAVLCAGAVTLASPANADDEDRRHAAQPARPVPVPVPWRADQVQRLSVEHPPAMGDPADNVGSIPIVLAGDPVASPPDSPDLRIDPNVPVSPFAGVCAVEIAFDGGAGRCTGSAISPHHVLTAAHCLDLDDDGVIDPDVSVSLVFNVDGPASHVVPAAAVQRLDIHPSYLGFPQSVNDDLAIVTLIDPLPAGIPIYEPFRGELAGGQLITLVGYGRSGTGVSGATVPSSPTVKRSGGNLAELFFEDDDPGGGAVEIWSADFDAPFLGSNCIGGPSLGNDVETGVAGGDSGGPVLVDVNGELQVWGTSTFVTGCTGQPFMFGSRSSGMVVNAYLPWIDTVVQCAGNCNDCNGNGVPDGVDLLDDGGLDENGNGLIDECEVMGPGDLWLGYTTRVLGYSFPAGGVVVDSDPPLAFIASVDYTPGGRLLVTATDFTEGGHGVWELDPADASVIGQVVSGNEGLSAPSDVLIGTDGLIYVLNPGPVSDEPYVTRHDPVTGALVDVFIADDPRTPQEEHGGLASPRKMELGPDGNIYIADAFQEGVPHFDGRTGAYLGLFAPDGPDLGGFGESCLVFRGDSLYVTRKGTVMRFDARSGAFIEIVVTSQAISGSVGDIQVDDGVVYVANNSTASVQRFDVKSGAPLGPLVTGISLCTDLELAPPAGADVPADLDGDGDVDSADLVLLILAWGPCGSCAEDLDGSGSVDIEDLLTLLLAWT